MRSWPRTRGRGEQTQEAESGPSADEDAVRLLESGVFDPEFYAAQVDDVLDSDLAAATHYLAHGSGRHSPHPLIDLTYFTDFFVQRLKTEARTKTLVDQLRRKSPGRALGPLFDARELELDRDVVREHPGGVLGWFLEHHGDDAPLPGRPDLTLRTARPSMLAAAEYLRAERRLRQPRIRDRWPRARAEKWRARWADAELPTLDGPLVSVVMPVRDRADVVGRAIESLQAQSLDGWELVVVDDGSTDDTVSVLESFARADPRVRVFRQDPTGVCAARNRALAEARAPYVAFLDSDNTWRSDFLRLALAAMYGEGTRAAYAAQVVIDEGSRPRERYRAYEGGLDHLLVMNHVDLNTLIVETDLAREVGGFDEALRRWVDHDFTIRLAQRTELELLPVIAGEYDDSKSIPDRITTREPDGWQWVVLSKYWVPWAEAKASAADRVKGRVTVVIPTFNDAQMTTRAVRAVLRNTPGADLEIVVVDQGSRHHYAISLHAGLMHRPGVHLERLPRNLNFAAGSNLGFIRGTGETVVFLNNDTEVRPGWLPPLLAALDDPSVLGAQPLLQYPDDTVQAAGTAFAVDGFLPIHLLAGHPPEDVARLPNRRFRVATAAALAMRAADVLALEGFDPMYINGMEDVDLCLRAAERRAGDFVVVVESQVTHHESQSEGRSKAIPTNRIYFMERWRDKLPPAELQRWRDIGFDFAHVSGDGLAVQAPRPVVVRRRAEGDTRPLPTRWGLANPAPGGEVGDLWGDTHFLRSLAGSLSRLGQEPVSYRHGAHANPTTAFDDVFLGVRGLDVICPVPTKVNVLWVISHPDEVSPAELDGFDLVYAASEPWAEEMARRAGREVRVLLQATDLTRRANMTRPPGPGTHPVFVGGNPRRRDRAVVTAALAAAVPLHVFGPFWDGVLPEGVLGGDYVPNDSLMQLYRDHGLVLSDHWPDMGRHGFLSNRLFDAVASGARVVSEPVEGLELFGGAVQPFHDVDELALLCRPEGRDRFPDDATMAEIADRVAREHSFDARAATLLGDVQPILDRRGPRVTP